MTATTAKSPLSDPGIIPNPYPVYSSLADNDPVHWCDGLNAWAVMRHADCASLLRDPRLKAERMEEVLDTKFDQRTLPPDNIYHRFTKNVMMYTDAPRHTELRASTHAAFTREAHAHYSEVIRQVADDLVAAVPSRTRELDAVRDLALVLPVNAAVRAFGVPEEDLDTILPAVETIMTYWSGPQEQPVPLDTLLEDLEGLHVYATELLRGQRGTVVSGTVIDRLAAGLNGSTDVPEFVIHQLVLLLIALFAPTTPGSTSSGLLAFATNPRQIERFRADSQCAANVANEVVRFNASNQFTWRLAGELVALPQYDVKIEPGQNVALFLGAANRDPRVFDRPDEFDLDRLNSNKQLSFGAGPHSCLGRQIASLELTWFFTALFARYQRIGLAGEPEWNTNLEFRSLRSLPISVG